VFRLLKMMELNPHSQKEIATETTRALKFMSSIDQVIHVFRHYYLGLEAAFFNSSLEWKSIKQEEESFKETLQKLEEKVREYQSKLQQFTHTMSRYRTFILKNEPNPYVRSRWGFSGRIVGPEPTKAKRMMRMIYSAEELNTLFTRFLNSLSRDFLSQQRI